jgi:hypothetical protein
MEDFDWLGIEADEQQYPQQPLMIPQMPISSGYPAVAAQEIQPSRQLEPLIKQESSAHKQYAHPSADSSYLGKHIDNHTYQLQQQEHLRQQWLLRQNQLKNRQQMPSSSRAATSPMASNSYQNPHATFSQLSQIQTMEQKNQMLLMLQRQKQQQLLQQQQQHAALLKQQKLLNDMQKQKSLNAQVTSPTLLQQNPPYPPSAATHVTDYSQISNVTATRLGQLNNFSHAEWMKCYLDFMRDIKKEVTKLPTFGGRTLDIRTLFGVVVEMGGFAKVVFVRSLMRLLDFS